ncbi:MAG: hypothetical protein IJO33_03480 [Bacilli bacterium]|nr:hypothetical protein [Bacilli bacterium]
MSEFSDISKKATAIGVASAVAVGGGIAVTHHINNNGPEYLETTTELSQEYKGQIPTSNEYTISGKTFVVEEPTTSIFGYVTETNPEASVNKFDESASKYETTTTYTISEDRIISSSRFKNLDDLYNYYMGVWNDKSAGRTPLEIIQNAHDDEIEKDNDLKTAAALMFLIKGNKKDNENQFSMLLNPQNKDINTVYEDNKDYMKLIQVLVLPGNSKEHLNKNVMADLEGFWSQFPKEFTTDTNYKSAVSCYIYLANEFTALVDVVIDGKIAATYNGAYLTVEVANIAAGYNVPIYPGVLADLQRREDDRPRGLTK